MANNAIFLLNAGLDWLEKGEYNQAKGCFDQVLNLDHESFASLDNKIREAAKRNKSFHMPDSTRKALLGIGVVYALQHDFQTAQDFILDAVYSARDPELNLIAGRYYLAIPDAEMDTSFGYFEIALKQNPDYLGKCDEMIKEFVKQKAVFYPFASLKAYLDYWEKIVKNTKNGHKARTPEDFIQRLLEVLDVLYIVGENELKNQFESLRHKG